ncbi:hypothetical protein PN441_09330 [Spirulina major CS-329]|uniref:hypothetical protein n=1 Tax=Spirulina TaxID=1154 RepID=UPI00232A7AA4|nr:MULTISPECIES: hypothetical protein [Spirulina]MDB9495051.1 hypothetical protein [Spirulina subsalsa CS-330]MDB9503273.1 hypothetical protein [Spirulina major CS-329]
MFEFDQWVNPEQYQDWVERLIQRVGLTRVRAECLVRLWIYALAHEGRPAPLTQLTQPAGLVTCSHRQAAELFYGDKEQGSDRSAGMMLDKLAALGFIGKRFDGNTTQITIQPLALALFAETQGEHRILPPLHLDDFDPRCDAIPVAQLLATNYNWMNHNTEAVPHRIARLLRGWARQYSVGMRVLRRDDNQNPVGFFLLYPVTSESEANFFGPPNRGLHLSAIREVDPFKMATPGDASCVAVFIRSWMIAPDYLNAYRRVFVQDVQRTLEQMTVDFPNLCDIYTLIIHPSYEALTAVLGFQSIGRDPQTSIQWMYFACDRFMDLDLDKALAQLNNG